MSRTSALMSATAVVGLVGASLFIAAPASAADLIPPHIVIVDSNTSIVYSVDGETSALTPVGTPSGILDISGVDVDETGVGYAIDDPRGDGGPVQSSLYTFNGNTGEFGAPLPISIEGLEAYSCNGLDLTVLGEIIVSCLVTYEETEYSVIGILDPITGIISDALVEPEDLEVEALSTDPTTGTIYAFAGNGDVLIIDLAGPSFSLAGTVTLNGGSTTLYGADFDANGWLWSNQNADDGEMGDFLATVVTSDWISTARAPYTTTDGSEFTIADSLTVWGTPVGPPAPAPAALPNMGLTDTPLVGGAALLLLLAGVAAIGVARTRKA